MKPINDTGTNYDDPVNQIVTDALHPNMGDGRLYALDVPTAQQAPVPYAQPSADDIVNAFDPSNKSSFSPLGVQNLYKVVSGYGNRAGVTDISPLLPGGAPPAQSAPINTATAPRPSNLIAWVALGALGFCSYKHFLKHRG